MMTDEPAPPPETPVEQTGSTGQTAQIPVNEPLPEPITPPSSEPIPELTPQVEASVPSEPAQPVSEVLPEPAPAPAEPVQNEPVEIPEVETEMPRQPTSQSPQPAAQAAQQVPTNPTSNTSPQIARELLVKARAKRQTQKQQKLDKIMVEIEKNEKIINDEVEKLLHCSDATASRYLAELVRQGKIKKVGTTGAGVTYIKA